VSIHPKRTATTEVVSGQPLSLELCTPRRRAWPSDCSDEGSLVFLGKGEPVMVLWAGDRSMPAPRARSSRKKRPRSPDHAR
jgi:hypothetical protein